MLALDLTMSDMSILCGAGNRPALSLDFRSETLDPRITFTRASSGTHFDSTGRLVVDGYNQIPNSTMQGGVSGAPGTSATSWGISPPIGLSMTQTYGETNGVPYVDVRFFGTVTTAGDCVLDPIGQSISPAASLGQAWTGRAQLALIAGSWPAGRQAELRIYERTAAGGFLAASSIDVKASVTGPTLVPITVTRPSFDQATVARSQLAFRVVTNLSDVIDFTVRIAAPQLEQSATLGQYSPTTTAANSGPRFDYDPATPAGTVGPELFPEGSFDSGLGSLVTFGTAGNVTSTGGAARINAADGVNSGFTKVTFLTVGKTYRLTLDLVSVTGAGINVNDNVGPIYATYTTSGSKTLDFVASTSNLQFKRAAGVVDATIDNISVREVAFAPRGLLIEEQRTNLALDSGEVSSGTGGVVVANQITAPDGSLADFFQEDTGNSEHYAGDRVVAVTAGTTYTWSFYAKLGLTGEARRACVRTGAQGPANVAFDLETGSGTLIGGAISFGSSSAGNGWWRCWIVYTATGTGGAVFRQQLSIGTNTVYTGNGTSGFYLWGAQLEAGAFPTSYIPTGTAAATRAADFAVMTGSNFSSWYNQTQGSFVAEFSRFGFDGVAGSVALVQADDTTANNRVALRITPRTASAGHQGTIVVGGAIGANDSFTQTDITNTVQKYAMAYQVGVGAVTRNGATANALTSVATLPTVTQLQLGQGPGASFLQGYIRSIRYYNTRLPNATLTALTA